MLILDRFTRFCDLISIILICLILLSCSKPIISEKESAFAELFPDVSFNEQIRQEIVRNEINQKIGRNIYLRLENLSLSRIAFPDDFGLRIIMYSPEQAQWIDIENDSIYITETTPILGTKSQGPYRFMGVGVSPVLENYDHKISIRIVVIGAIYEHDQATDQLVGAYTDLTLSP